MRGTDPLNSTREYSNYVKFKIYYMCVRWKQNNDYLSIKYHYINYFNLLLLIYINNSIIVLFKLEFFLFK